jgi:hypothetical protein
VLELDYVVLADYVRQDGGVTNIMAAGIDTFMIPQVPAAVPVGIVARIRFSSEEEAGARHRVDLTFQGEDGPVLEISNVFPAPSKPPGTPPHWWMSVSLVFKIALSFPRYGDYSLELVVDGDPDLAKSIDVRAINPESGHAV